MYYFLESYNNNATKNKKNSYNNDLGLDGFGWVWDTYLGVPYIWYMTHHISYMIQGPIYDTCPIYDPYIWYMMYHIGDSTTYILFFIRKV